MMNGIQEELLAGENIKYTLNDFKLSRGKKLVNARCASVLPIFRTLIGFS